MDVSGLNHACHGAGGWRDRRLRSSLRAGAGRTSRRSDRAGAVHAWRRRREARDASPRPRQAVRRRRASGRFSSRHAGDRAFQIVRRRQQVAGKPCRRISNRLVPIPPGLPADILLLGEAAQQAILGRRQFRGQFRDVRLGALGVGAARLIMLGTGRGAGASWFQSWIALRSGADAAMPTGGRASASSTSSNSASTTLSSPAPPVPAARWRRRLAPARPCSGLAKLHGRLRQRPALGLDLRRHRRRRPRI